MIALLQQQGVEITKASEEFSLGDLHTYFTAGTLSKKFPAGSYIIRTDQPAKRLITALMEQEPVLTDTLFYDISSWSLPVAYGVETYWTGKIPSGSPTVITDVEFPKGSVIGGKASYAYLMKTNTNESMKALAWLLQNDIKANFALKGFTINGRQFPPGTVIIPTTNNGSDVHGKMEELSERFHTIVYASNTGLTETGINLGSDRSVRLKKPKIIVATNSPVSAGAFGAIWSMFDREYGIDFIPMKVQQIRNTDLHDYTAMIFPDDGSDGGGYRGLLDSGAVQKIKTWISGGGTFIGIEGGAAFASIGKIAGVKIKEKKKDDEKKKDNEKKKDADSKKEEKLSDEELEKRMTVAEKERKNRLDDVPGTVMRVKLDGSHPLGFGYDGTIAVFKTTKTMFELSDRGYNVGMYTKSPRLSGYISAENEKMLEDTPFLVHEQLGGGNVILFTDDPNFRLFWDGLNKLFLNSVLLMPSIHNVSLTSDEN